jgi:hypothetical protein
VYGIQEALKVSTSGNAAGQRLTIGWGDELCCILLPACTHRMTVAGNTQLWGLTRCGDCCGCRELCDCFFALGATRAPGGHSGGAQQRPLQGLAMYLIERCTEFRARPDCTAFDCFDVTDRLTKLAAGSSRQWRRQSFRGQCPLEQVLPVAGSACDVGDVEWRWSLCICVVIVTVSVGKQNGHQQ